MPHTIAALLRLRLVTSGEARRLLATRLGDEARSEARLATHHRDLAHEKTTITANLAELGLNPHAAIQAAYLARAARDISDSTDARDADHHAGNAARQGYAQARADLRAADLLAQHRAKRQAVITARRDQFTLEDSCRR